MNKKIIASLTGITGIIAVSTAAIHVFNKLYFASINDKLNPDLSNYQYYNWRFGKIGYQKKGNSGTPVLLIHDTDIGCSSFEFSSLLDYISEKHEVYAIDLIGFGYSEKPNITYTDFLFVQLISDFIKNVIERKTDIVATGESVSTAIMTCHNDPELVKNIILINPQDITLLNQTPTKRTKLLKLLIDIPVIGTLIFNIVSSRRSLLREFHNNYFYAKDSIRGSMINTYISSAHYPDYKSKYSFSSKAGNYLNINIVHALKEINHNILIIYGEKENNIREVIERYQSYNPSIEAFEIENCMHLPHIENAKQVSKELEYLLNI